MKIYYFVTIAFVCSYLIACDKNKSTHEIVKISDVELTELQFDNKILDIGVIIPQSLGQVLVLFMFHNHKGFPYFNTGNSFKKFPKVLECGKPVPHAAAFVFVFSSYSS